MATEITDEQPPDMAVKSMICLLEVGQTCKTDDLTYGSARSTASKVGKDLARIFNVTREKESYLIYITRVA